MILRPAADVVRCDDAGACSSLTLPDGWYLIAGSEGRENEAIGPVLHKQYMCDFGGIGTLGDECKRAIPIIFDQLRPELCGGVEAFPRIPAVASPAKANVHLERLAFPSGCNDLRDMPEWHGPQVLPWRLHVSCQPRMAPVTLLRGGSTGPSQGGARI